MTAPVLVYITVPDAAAAEPIARALIAERLAACVNVLPGARSYYRWEGEVQSDSEAVLIAKSTESLVADLTTRVIALHPYELPAISVVPIVGGSAAFLAWIESETTRDPAARAG